MNGSYPIGACVVNAQGNVIARGRNRIGEETFVDGVISGRRQAHAEMNALLALPPLSAVENAALTIYTTVEPCPMCLGAILMQRVGRVAYAAADLYAGHTRTLSDGGFTDRRRLQVSRAPEHITHACEIWQIAFQIEKGMALEHAYFEVHRQHKPDVYDKGMALHQNGTLPALRVRKATLEEALAVLT